MVYAVFTGASSYLINSNRLPENLRVEDAKSSIECHEPGVFNLALRRQHPVKWVPVNRAAARLLQAKKAFLARWTGASRYLIDS